MSCRITIILASLLVPAGIVACGPTEFAADAGWQSADGQPLGGEPDARGWSEFADATPTQRCDEIDILFVIDNSASMSLEQSNLVANFPQFVQVLDTFLTEDGNPIDYRVGVITTGVTKSWQEESAWPGLPPSSTGQTGSDGMMMMDCGMTQRWLERGDANVADAFSCIAQVGTAGPIREMPLEAIRLALTERVVDGTNFGFLRSGALLGIVVITDEDDCSRQDDGFTVAAGQDVCDTPEPVATYAGLLDSITGARDKWALAVIAGPGPGMCFSSLGSAYEAVRLKELASMAGDNGVVGSICEGDLAGGLQDALAAFDLACRDLID
jgi:hypothetical protein